MATAADPAIAVRAAQPADADALADIGARAWRATYTGIVPEAALAEWTDGNLAAWRAALGERPPGGEWRPWVADRGGRVLGYATTSAARAEWLPPPDGAGELTNLYLDPDVIGTGVGRLLYGHAVADLAARGFDPLVVWAFRDNARAVGFYRRMGLAIDVPDHDWVLAGVPCPIVRFRGPLTPPPATA
ncbi:MAG TPA: GNAT family N-acetyltransferase [Candidatus Limnocylindria bacterium]|nr:GNAT family N-acetyltransferase [Candidatus Limnocylindria bacterium]